MSYKAYKKELDRMRGAVESAKSFLVFAMKITAVLLAISLCAMVISLFVSLLSKDGGRREREDTTPPVITFGGSEDFVIYATLGETVSYRKYISATDNSGDCTIEFDNSEVQIGKEGVYTAYCIATDSAGNVTKKAITVVIKKAEFSRESLMAEIERLCGELGITKSMTKEEQVKAVFEFVNSPKADKNTANIQFDDESNSARENWQLDWIEEACLTLKNRSGDCYSYYSLSKAFFEYLGIENVGIKRDDGAQAGTHFWLAVNIGSEGTERWYYYDATRLKYQFNEGSGCLFTREQLDYYNVNINAGFYTHTTTKGLPKIATQKINTAYRWK